MKLRNANQQVYEKNLSHILLHVFCFHFVRTHEKFEQIWGPKRVGLSNKKKKRFENSICFKKMHACEAAGGAKLG